MASLKFVDQHNMIACLEKSEENTEFHQIVDFLSTRSINYALTRMLTLDAFDDLDADDRDYIQTEDVVKEGRQSNETEKLNKGSGDKGGSTKELVSTAVPKTVSTARPDVDAARQEDSTPPTTTKDALEVILMCLRLPRDADMKARKNRPRQFKVDCKAEPSFNSKIEEEFYNLRREPKFLAETIATQRKFRAAQRSAEIRSKDIQRVSGKDQERLKMKARRTLKRVEEKTGRRLR
ncbi:hypothetical protein Tco_0456588 [Tanacetum coccineum]